MNYEIVQLQEKIVVGKSILTSNSDAKMLEKIGKLWCELYDCEHGYYAQIANKANGNAIGLYSDYNADGYSLTAGVEVTEFGNPELTRKIIIAGKYAKFSVVGNMVTDVAKVWEDIWKLPLERSYTGDFEEYLACDCDHIESCDIHNCNECHIDIYIALK